ncbi:hypothetical protein V8C37DRAFT_113498 [Trichoderma ceciliae]
MPVSKFGVISKLGATAPTEEDKDRAFGLAEKVWQARTLRASQTPVVTTKGDIPAFITEGDVLVDSAEDNVPTDNVEDNVPADITEDYDPAAIADNDPAVTIEKGALAVITENHTDNANPDAKDGSSRDSRAASDIVAHATKSARTPELQQKLRNLEKLESTNPELLR